MKYKQINRTISSRWFAIFFCVLFLDGYSQQLVVNDPSYTVLTPFVAMSADKSNVFQIALAKTKSDKDNYVILLENHVTDFSIAIVDTTHLVDVLMRSYFERARDKSSWLEEQRFTLPVLKKNVASSSKGILIAFGLSSTDAFDLKGQTIGDFTIHRIDNSGKYKSESKRQISISEPANNFFKTYSSKITSLKGSFDDLSKFKTNKIVFYSLFSKDTSLIRTKLGPPIKTQQDQSKTINFYETDNGVYRIVFEGNKSNRIELTPKARIKYVGKIFVLDSFPIEITGCDCGEFSSKETKSSVGDKTNHGVRYSFKDGSSHAIEFRSDGIKYLEMVVAEKS